VAFWLPQIVKNFSGLGNVTVALISSLPYLCASIGMVWVARSSDATGERRFHLALCALGASLALGLGAAFQAGHPLLAFLALCAAATGIWSTLGPFWSLPAGFLSGRSAAGGLALINSVGNLGGFVGPNIIGYIKDATHRFESGMLALAFTLLVAGLLALSVPKDPKRQPDQG
jgi:ACS family tartrate transporter-like MFS transporter